MKILWLTSQMVESGGGERFVFEVSNALNKIEGVEVYILTDAITEAALFKGKYSKENITILTGNKSSRYNLIDHVFQKFLSLKKLRKEFNRIKPDILICQSEADSVRLNITKFLSKTPIFLFNFGQMFQFLDDVSKYSFIFKSKIDKILKLQPDYAENINQAIKLDPISWNLNELTSILKFFSVRSCSRVYTLSNQVIEEVKILYNKESFLLRGAISHEQIMKDSIRNPNNVSSNPNFLIVCRLHKKKRVDIILSAFLQSKSSGSLTIIGDGPEKANLEMLSKASDSSKSITFLSNISDNDLFYQIKSCDYFISMDNSDFVITAIEALACGRRLLLSEHFDLSSFDPALHGVKKIVPNEENLAIFFDNPYVIEDPAEDNILALEKLTWNYVAEKILQDARE